MDTYFQKMQGNTTTQQLDPHVSSVNNTVSQFNVENIRDGEKLANCLKEINTLFNNMQQSSDLSGINDQYNKLVTVVSTLKTEIANISNVNINNDSLSRFSELVDTLNGRMLPMSQILRQAFDETTQTRIREVGDQAVKTAEQVTDASKKIADAGTIMAHGIYDASLQTDQLKGNLKQLSDSLNTSKSDTVKFYEELNKMSEAIGSQKFGDLGLDDVSKGLAGSYSELERYVTNVKAAGGTLDRELANLSQNPQKIADEYTKMYESVEKIFNIGKGQNSLDGVSASIKNLLSVDNGDMVAALTMIDQFLPKVEKYQQVLEGSKGSLQSFYSALQMEGMKNVEFLDTNKDVMNKVREQIDTLKSYESDMIKKLQETKSSAFNSQIVNAMNPENDYAKLMNVATGTKHTHNYENDMHRVGSYATIANNGADKLLDNMTNMSGIQQRRTTNALDIESISQQSQSIENAMHIFSSKRKAYMDSVANSMTEYGKTGDETHKLAGQDKISEIIPINEKVSEKVNNMGDLIKVRSKKEFDKLPEEAKKEIENIHKLIKNMIDSNGETITMAKIFGMSDKDIQGLKKVNEELKNTDAALDKVDTKTKSWFKQLNEDLNISGKIKSMSSALGFFGMAAIPLSLGGLKNFGTGAVKDWVKQDDMMANSALTEMSMGGNPTSDAAARTRIIDQGAKYFGMSNGMIKHEDYNNAYTNLTKNVGGHYNQDDASAQKDMLGITEGTFALSKVYNISESTTAQAAQTFYKDLRMGASETVDVIKNLTLTAISSNIPVDKYVQTVTNLAASFRKIGLNGKTAVGMMDEFLTTGMTLEDATSMTQSVGNAVGSFANNTSLSAYNGVMSGQFSDPFAGAAFAVDKFDENGKQRGNYGEVMAKSMDTWFQTQLTLSGGNKDIATLNLNREFKTMGFSDKDADIAVDKYLKNPKLFEDFMNETTPGHDKNEMTLVGQPELEAKIAEAADKVSAATKVNAELANAQWLIAGNLGHIADDLAGPLIDTLHNIANSLFIITKGIGDLFNKFANTELGKNVGEFATEHPGLALGGLVLGASGIKAGVKGVTSLVGKGFSAGANGIKGLFTGSKASTAIGAEITEDTLQAATTAAAKSEGALAKLTGKLGKAGKFGLLAAGVAGTAYLGSKLFGGSDDDNQSAESAKVLAGQMSADGQNISSRLDDIHTTLKMSGGYSTGTGYGTSYNSPYDRDIQYDRLKNGAYNADGTPVTTNNTTLSTKKVVDPNYDSSNPVDSTLNSLAYMGTLYGGTKIVNAATGFNVAKATSTTATVATKTAASEVAKAAAKKEAADLATKEAGEKFLATETKAASLAFQNSQKVAQTAAKELAEKQLALKASEEATKKAATQLGAKTITKSIAGAGVAVGADVVFGAFDYGSHAVKGDLMQGDAGRVIGETSVSAGWTAMGATIGTLIAPGIGTAIGAGVAGLASIAANMLTKDENGKGINDRASDAISTLISGKTGTEVEKARQLYKGDPTKLMTNQLQSLGIDAEQSVKLSSTLSKYGGELTGFTNESKLLWASSFNDLISNGVAEKDAITQAKDIVKDGTLSKQISDANVQMIKELLASQGANLSTEQVKNRLNTVENNIGDIVDINEARKSGANDEVVKKLATDKAAKQEASKVDVTKILTDDMKNIFNDSDIMGKLIKRQFEDKLTDLKLKQSKADPKDKSSFDEDIKSTQRHIETGNQYSDKYKQVSEKYDSLSDKQKSKISKEQYVTEGVNMWLSSFDASFMGTLRDTQQNWIKSINDEVKVGSTTTLEKIKQMVLAIDGTSSTFTKIFEDLATLQQKGNINISNSNSLFQKKDSNTLLESMANAGGSISSEAQ
jgi:hypothetical protein